MITLPIYLQMVLEYNALQAGLSIAPLSLSMFAIAMVAAPTARKSTPRTRKSAPKTAAAEPAPAPPLPSKAERAAYGKSVRQQVPLGAHAELVTSNGGSDPVALLESQSATRVPELDPIRYGRMLVSAFTF